ncbi:hypothetical protein O995_00112 [Enterococcus faecalis BM4539]|uniref:diguanylate cyclase n=1 Tax=Enterococcus TaxID=1350 RepID=UPI0003B8852B|nr:MULTISPECIES: diguanylate cyclase [Enterococcus]ERT29998.1 hypothetical protein O995_00112 [Enterococcus faecalis BM4539]ERT32490.1 hypothetical protein O993_01334 [Enterococcus faecium BM4538]
MLKVRPKLRVLIVDDSELNREMLGSMLGDEYEILEAENGVQAVEIMREHVSNLSLILLDVQMPQMDGLELLKHMGRLHWIDVIPVIMISSETAPQFIERAYDLGATDYIARPYNTMIVRRRVANVILSFARQRQLMEIITQQISKKEKDNRLMLSILSHIVEFRNGESGLHVIHINIITDLLLRQYMLKIGSNKITSEDISLISMASALHDIGKIAIPEEILNKPGRLSVGEYQIMQGHCMAGANILMDLPIDRNEPLLKTAYEICRWHHERYDGSGYPDGLKGDTIPLSAQVVALADVYDALTSERCYKSAYSHDTAMKMIFDGQCGVFHPLLLECLCDIGDTLQRELTAKDTFDFENTINETSHITEQLQRYEKKRTDHCSMSGPEARVLLQYLNKVFDVVRLVDATKNCQVNIDEAGNHQDSEYRCYDMWSKEDRCENCISAKCMSSKGSLTKLKFVDECIYHVRATYVEVDGLPYSLELIDKITEETLLGGHGKEDVVKYITAHNHRLYVDILTGVYNRRYYEEQLRDMFHISAAAMLDMDHFKAVNDTYGHLVGDMTLKQAAIAIKNSVRKTDDVVRLGGDEFFIVFREIPFHVLQKKLEAIRACVENIVFSDYPQLHFSISIGGVYGPGKTSDLLNIADKLLYQAKREQVGLRVERLAGNSLMEGKGQGNEAT